MTDANDSVTPSPAPAPSPAPIAGQPVDQVMAGQVNNPALPPGTELTPIPQEVQSNELMNGKTSTLDPTGANVPQGTNVTAPEIKQTQGQSSQTNPNDALNQINPNDATYTAATGNNAAQGTAAQGQVNPLSTVQGQLAALYASIDGSNPPPWAKAAIASAESMLASRGLGASSIGAMAITSAVQASALNIAAQDASTYFQMDMKNLDNSQQMAMQNLMNRQQGLLSDQSATNAARQFNAASSSQLQQFMSSLVANINNQNADRSQAMSQFNAGQANAISSANAQYNFNAQTFNAQQQTAINQFNANLQNQREQFNGQNAFAVEQSNVLWRRSVNTANNAAVNAANQFNVQNRFGISSTALNNIWQQFRDEASWIFTASENQKNRDFNAAQQANNRSFASNGEANPWASAVGGFAGQLLI